MWLRKLDGTPRRAASILASALSFIMVMGPVQLAYADVFDQAAKDGQSFSNNIKPNAESLFHTDDDGDYVFSTGEGTQTTISPNELFGDGADDWSEFSDLEGKENAIQSKTDKTTGNLKKEKSWQGEAYRAVMDSSDRSHPDLSNDPIWQNTEDTLAELFAGDGEFNACEITKKIIENKNTMHVPEYETCERLPSQKNHCEIRHNYSGTVIEHVSGPLNITSYEDHTHLWLGKTGDNYWQGGRCSFFEEEIVLRVVNPEAVTSAVLTHAKFDDYIRVWVNDEQVYNGPGSYFPPDTSQSCELNTNYSRNPNVDLTRFFKDVEPETEVTVHFTVAVGDVGEGHVEFDVYHDPRKAISKDEWEVVKGHDCDTAIDALNNGFADGDIVCSNMPETTLTNPSLGDCVELDGKVICEADLDPSPYEGVSRFCRYLTVDSTMTFNQGSMECWTDPDGNEQCPDNDEYIQNSCKAYEQDSQCQFISSTCVSGAQGEGEHCYVYEDRYDCGEDVPVTSLDEESTYTCPGSVRCMGDDCVALDQESNHDFAKAAAALQAAQHIGMDMSCPDDGNDNIDEKTCKVFGGEAETCKKAVGGTVNCCKKPSGVSLTEYITLILAVNKASGLVNDGTTVGGMAFNSLKETGAWKSIGEQAGKAWNTITKPFGSALDANSAASAGKTTIFKEFQQKAINKTAEFIGKNFGENVGNMFFQNGAEAGSSVYAQNGGGALAEGAQAQMTTAAATALSVVMWAYTIYTVSKIVIQMVWKCSEDEMNLNVQRQLKTTHYLGSYCKSKVLGQCIERRKAYCVFNSPLSRILQEQIRDQLGIGWGEAEDPDCRALTIDEINRADWDQIDLSEWMGILETTGHFPSAEDQAEALYSMDALTGKDTGLDFDGDRDNTLERNQKRLEDDETLSQNEHLREELWGYAEHGYDKEGYDEDGFNEAGYDREGYDRHGYDKDGWDREGYDRDGFDKDGWDHEGYDREGYGDDGYNRAGYDRDGYNAHGYDKDGYNRNGFDHDGFDKNGFDKHGFDHQGFDKHGFDKNGFDKNGYDKHGYDKDGFNKHGYDKDGYNRQGYNKQGYDRNGFDKNGYNKKGYDKNGYDRNGFDKNGWDKNGFDQNGYDKDGYDRAGYDRAGYNRSGYDRNGRDRHGCRRGQSYQYNKGGGSCVTRGRK